MNSRFSKLQSVTRSSLLLTVFCFAAGGALAFADDQLQGHLRETTGSVRLVRPALGISGGTTAHQLGTGLKDTVDESNFDLKASASKPSMRCDNSTWNPWPTLRPTPRLLPYATAYRSPILTGNVSDLGAVERAWQRSSLTRTDGNQRRRVSVSLAMCPSPQFRENWEILMRELAADGTDGKWRRFQDAVCGALMERFSDGDMQGPSGEPFSMSQHVALKSTGEIIYGPGQQPKFTDARNLAIQNALQQMNLQLPAGTAVNEVHFRIQVSLEPVGMPQR